MNNAKCWGANDAFQENNCGLDKITYRKIISALNKAFIRHLLREGYVTLPYNIGNIVIIKKRLKPVFKEGKLVIYNGIDWVTTKKLWETDATAKLKKTLVRFTSDTMYKIKYYKSQRFRNGKFLKFTANISLKRELVKLIKEGKFDTIYGEEYKYKAGT